MSGERILLTGIDPQAAAAFEQQLARLGYQVEGTVRTFTQVLALGRQACPQLVLLDLHLPGLEDLASGLAELRSAWDTTLLLYLDVSESAVLTPDEVITRLDGFIYMQPEDTYLDTILQAALRRHAKDRQLHESNQRYRSLFEHNHDVVLIIDPASARIVEANPAACRYYGFTYDELVAMTIAGLNPAPLETILGALSQSHSEVNNQWFFQHRLKDGSLRDVEINNRPIRLDGRPLLFSIIRDVTSQRRVESALKVQQDTLHTILNVAPAVIGTVRQRVIQWISERVTGMIGYSSSELIGKSARILYESDEEYERVGQVKYDQIRQTGMGEIETRWKHKDGRLVDILLRSAPTNQEDLSQDVIFTAWDISDQKRAEEDLREGERRYRLMFENNPIPMWVYDLETLRFIAVNRAALEKYGYSLDEFLSMTIKDIRPPEDVPALLSNIHSWETNLQKSGPWTHILKDGSTILVEITSHSIEYQNRKARLVQAQDVTERVSIETALRASEEKFQRLFSESPDANLIITDGVFSDCNRAAQTLFGLSCQQIIGLRPDQVSPEFQPDGQSSRKKAQAIIASALRSRRKRFEWVHCRKDGSQFWVEVVLNAIMLDEKPSLFVTLRDITGRKQAEEALQQSEERYRQLFETMLNGFALHEMIYDENDQPIDYRFLAVNPAFESLTGLRAADLIGKTVLDAMPETEPYWIETYARVAQTGKPVLYENYAQEIRKYYRVFAFSPRHGQFATLVEDVTELKEHERYQNALIDLSSALRHVETSQEMVPLIVEMTARFMEAGTAALALVSPTDRDKFIFLAGVGKGAAWVGSTIDKSQGITGYALRTRRPYFQNEPASDRLRLQEYENHYTACVAAIPLVMKNQNIGVMLVGKETPFNEADARILAALCEIIANALQRARLQEETQRNLQYMSALRKIDQAISAAFDLENTMDVFLEQVIAQLKVDAADVWLVDSERGNMVLTAAKGFRLAHHYGETSEWPDAAAEQGSILYLAEQELDRQPDSAFQQMRRAEGFVEYYGLPFIAKNRVCGVLQIWNRQAMPHGAEWFDFLEMLAGQAAIAIADVQLFFDLQQSNQDLVKAYELTLEGWSKALEIRDSETEGHSRRVTEITVEIARKLGVCEEEIVHIRRGALLHDIGKMGIPDAILNKKGPLSPEEWVVMRTHPLMAYQVLSVIPFLHAALDIPHYHHEKWDGSGYPHGLQGEQIPLAARIFAVVDVWDALLSDRPYRPAWTREKALAYIQEQSGTHFDPQVVRVFLESGYPDQV